MKIEFRAPTPLRLACGGVLGLAFVATTKGLLSGQLEVLSLILPAMVGLAMYWIAMQTLAKDGVIHQFLRRNGLILKLRDQTKDD